MGWSRDHAASVAVIRNSMTGNLSPQFHVVFDPWFETVTESGEEIPPETWDVLVTNHRHENDLDPEDARNHQIHDDWLTKEELLDRRTSLQQQQQASVLQPSDLSRVQEAVEDHQPIFQEEEATFQPTPRRGKRDRATPSTPTTRTMTPRRVDFEDETTVLSPQPVIGKRNRVQRTVMNIADTNTKSYFTTLERVRELQEVNRWSQRSALAHWALETMDPDHGFIDESEPDFTLWAYKATTKGNNPDLPNYRQAMEGPHSDEFKVAMRTSKLNHSSVGVHCKLLSRSHCQR